MLLIRVPVVSGTEDKAIKTLESVAEVLGQRLSGLVLLMALLLCLLAGFSIVFFKPFLGQLAELGAACEEDLLPSGPNFSILLERVCSMWAIMAGVLKEEEEDEEGSLVPCWLPHLNPAALCSPHLCHAMPCVHNHCVLVVPFLQLRHTRVLALVS